MKLSKSSYSLVAILTAIFLFTSGVVAQVVTTAEWSTRIWAAASDGNWEVVDSLLDQVPNENEDILVAFREQVDAYRTHQVTQIQTISEARDVALAEMITHREEGSILQAMQSAVKAQTLSKTLDDLLFNDEVQSVLTMTVKEINSLSEHGNVLTAQTLLFYLRTFYEGTSRRDLYDRWNDKLEAISLHVGLLRQYAPEHLHGLFALRAELLGDEAPDEFNKQASDNWIERVDGIEKDMVIYSLDLATNYHIDAVSWETLMLGGLKAIQNLGTTPVISETFEKAGDKDSRDKWLATIQEEMEMLPRTLKHIPGKRTLIQMLDRLIEANTQAMNLPEGVILREFGDGAMGMLDKYSGIIWPDESRRFKQQTEGSFVGVGIVIKENNKGEIMVVNPIEGAPAYYGGIQPDDVILAVDGKSASGWSLNDAVDRITGPRRTAVTLTLRRVDVEEPINITLTRDSIKLHSVQGWWKEGLNEHGQPVWDWFIDKDNQIGYIKLTSFSEESYSDILAAVREMKKSGQPNGLILDLRYNPGGLLQAASNIANLFVSSGTIVSGETAGGNELFRMRAHPNRARLADWSVVILINQGSASASEIVAGSIQAHNAGIIVGKRSWGKGSVQTVHQITNDSEVKLTTQYYRLPSPDGGTTPGRLVHKRRGSTDWGVVPDVEVGMSPTQITQSNELRQHANMLLVDSVEGDRPDINRLISEGLDPQLETALLLLRANAIPRIVSDHRHANLN